MTIPVTTLRPERGYSATNYDGSLAQPQKSLRRQTGHFYDVKKVRNSERMGEARLLDAIANDRKPLNPPTTEI